MIKNLVLAVVVAMATMSHAHADVPRPTQQAVSADDAFVQWVMPVMNLLERGGQAMLPFGQIDWNFGDGDQAAARTAIQDMTRQSTAARVTIAGLRAELAAMREFAHPQATSELVEVSRVLLTDSERSLSNMDRMLAVLLDFGAAYQRGDDAALQRIAPQLQGTATVMTQSQATMLRARQRLVPRGSSQFHAIAGMASMYDGMGHLLSPDESFDVSALEAVINAMNLSIAAERGAIALERAQVPASGRNAPIVSQIIDVRQQLADLNGRSRDVLVAAVADARAGRSNADARLDRVDELGRLEYEYQAATRRQIELYAQIQ